MKIALLTIWHEKNYGAELQAYATIKILQQLGYDVEMIDIRLSDLHRSNLKGKIGNYISKFGPSQRKFEKFWKTYIPVSQRYRSLGDLQNDPPVADVYMVGSDQVWNPDIVKDFTNVYFLDFGSDKIKRVSFASSFGVSTWKRQEMIENVRTLLRRFAYISCREDRGVKILKDVFDITAEHVLDPTILLGDFHNLTDYTAEKNTLVYYPLFTQYNLEKYVKKLGDELGLSVINANWSKNILGTIIWNRNSLEGWIKDIAEAKFVITPSFHGVAMSIVHHRNFAVLVAQKDRATRIFSLLSQLGLQDRVFYSIEELDSAKPWNQTIDYTEIDEKLKELRKNSIAYLIKSMN